MIQFFIDSHTKVINQLVKVILTFFGQFEVNVQPIIRRYISLHIAIVNKRHNSPRSLFTGSRYKFRHLLHCDRTA